MGPIYYKWEKYHTSNNSWIDPSHRALNITSPDLRFNVISEADEGVYRCIATNDDGSVISNNATIHVYGEFSVSLNLIMSYMYNIGPPIIKFITNHAVSLEGGNDVDAVHPLQINWYRGKNLVTQNEKQIMLYNETKVSRQLTVKMFIDPVNRSDDGVYTCQAFNQNDSFSELKTKLTVQCMVVI